MNIRYENKATTELADGELSACSELYGRAYGRYAAYSPIRPGERIRMGSGQYRARYCKQGVYLVRAMDGESQVGHAFYIRRRYEPYGTMTWVLQLVVDRAYRQQGIASAMLRSIWGFSNDFAWGLASANPCTVKTLESATFRRCSAALIQKNLEAIRLIGADTSFVSEESYVVSEDTAQVDTRFYADNTEYRDSEGCSRRLGELRPGHEWLAFTFQEQPVRRESFRRHFARMMRGYEAIQRDAYGRMEIQEHPWAKGKEEEVGFVSRYFQPGRVLDLGCGIGRHAIRLAESGYEVVAIDYAMKHIAYARSHITEKAGDKVHFQVDDVRTYQDGTKYEQALCLYDVIGSYPDAMDNRKIIKTAYDHLRKGGVFILSVMNMELTATLIHEENIGDIQQRPDILEQLPPGNVMQKTGQVFQAEYLAYDTRRGLVYRKEQFGEDRDLPAEYIIRDRRYRMDEIRGIVEGCGFVVEDARYVQAGHFGEPLAATDRRAKEICLVCRKR